jgi:hypothetical protein
MPKEKQSGRPREIPDYQEGAGAAQKFDDAMTKILSISKSQILELEKKSKDSDKKSK